MKLDEEKEKQRRENEIIQAEHQMKMEGLRAALTMFGPMKKKDVYGGGPYRDKW
jgi:hypothetical protein